MDIKKALTEDTVMLCLKSETKPDIIREMIDHLVAVGKIRPASRDAALQAVMTREAKMSTGMQSGVAIPHGKTDAVDSLAAAIAVKKEGADFDSLDGQPSRIFVMIVSPASTTGPHIQFLAEISRLLNDPKVQERILQAQTAEEILEII
ncbi:MAG: PTS sugar transporter subunit IIA [Kiritimatiellae bacterium]|nr:PTS sugar transporter subunit IIA [Kiritimatiellia bacterium]